jgi:hypothetical protein
MHGLGIDLIKSTQTTNAIRTVHGYGGKCSVLVSGILSLDAPVGLVATLNPTRAIKWDVYTRSPSIWDSSLITVFNSSGNGRARHVATPGAN